MFYYCAYVVCIGICAVEVYVQAPTYLGNLFNISHHNLGCISTSSGVLLYAAFLFLSFTYHKKAKKVLHSAVLWTSELIFFLQAELERHFSLLVP